MYFSEFQRFFNSWYQFDFARNEFNSTEMASIYKIPYLKFQFVISEVASAIMKDKNKKVSYMLKSETTFMFKWNEFLVNMPEWVRQRVAAATTLLAVILCSKELASVVRLAVLRALLEPDSW